jgi:PhoH-like ATPase
MKKKMKSEQIRIEVVEDMLIDEVYQAREQLTDMLTVEMNVGEYLMLQSDVNVNKKALLYKSGNKIKLLQHRLNSHEKKGRPQGKDVLQVIYQQLLNDDDCQILVCMGGAGSGKSYLAIDWAVNCVLESKNKKLIMTKPLYQIGSSDAIGTLPGNVDEKMGPFLDSYGMVLNKLFPSKEYIQSLFDKEYLEYKAIEFFRGCSFDNVILVVDEVQNLSYTELRSIISRMGNNCKLILLADPHQIDVKQTWKQSGLYQILNAQNFLKSSICGKIELIKCFRGPIADLMINIDKEILDKLNTPISYIS